MAKINVLLIQNLITHYTLPIYNLLAKDPEIRLTVAHYDSKPVNNEKFFNEILLHSWKLGSLIFSKENLYSICVNYDVVISLADLHWFSHMLLGFIRNRKFKLICWGIGVSASYKHRFDENKKWDFLRYFFMKRADALIFYSSYPINKYIKHGFAEEKLFVAHNTIPVNHTIRNNLQKDCIIFIGTLYFEKGIFELLSAYKKAYTQTGNIPTLIIIGDGVEFKNIVSWVKQNNLDHKIKLTGAIYDDEILEQYFQKAIACISPDQAGLSVLKSMGFGVTFITRYNSITGGERLNITNYETGILYRNKEELVSIICNMERNRDLYKSMGENSRKFYDNFRRPDQMVKGFLDAIEYVLSIK